MSSPSGSWSGAAGSGVDHHVADAHAGYHAETRRHQTPDGLVDDVVTWETLKPHLMRALLFLVAPTGLLLLWLLLSYLASLSTPDPVTVLVTAVIPILAVLLYLTGVAAFFAPAKEPIAEYAQLLEGRGAAAPAASERIRAAAAARRSPADVRPGTVGGVPVLLFHQHSERAMLLVQPYGEDLYVGWTMWRARSSATLLGHFLRDTFGRFAPSPRFSAELRAASTRAMRESVHSLAREGVAAAVHGGPSTPSAAGSWSSAPHATGSWSAPPPPAAAAHPAAGAVSGYVHPPEHSPLDGDRRSGALPAGAPPVDPHEDWYRPRADEEAAGAPRADPAGREQGRPEDGWGPPPHDRW